MTETDNRKMIEGADNYGQVAWQFAKVAKNVTEKPVRMAGGAAGGPWGAALSAAWSMRHTFFKVLVCLCLVVLFFVILLVSLPGIVTNDIFGLDGTLSGEDMTLSDTYKDLAEAVDEVIKEGYDLSYSKVEKLISNGGYDYDLSMAALVDHGKNSAGYDVCYILAAYSVAMQQRDTSKEDMLTKLRRCAGEMFPVTSKATGTEGCLECTIHPFNEDVVTIAFDLDLDADYGTFHISCRQAIQYMAKALKQTLYASAGGGQGVPLTDAELIDFMNRQNCSPMRKHILTTALSLVGKVPYFWGGKSAPGWNDEWNTPKLVTAAGDSSSGTIRPYGLDCSGFSDWVYNTATGVSLYAGTWSQWDNTYAISPSELLVGDLGFLMNSDGQGWNHVLIFAGYGKSGERMWVHCTDGQGVVVNRPSYEATLSLRRAKGVDFDAPVKKKTN